MRMLEVAGACLAAGAVVWIGVSLWQRRRNPILPRSPDKAEESVPVRRKRATDPAGFAAKPKDGRKGEAAELVAASLLAGAGLFAVGHVFYDHPVIAMLFSLGGLLAPAARRRKRQRRQQEELKQQFKQALHSLATSLSAGRSVESAFQAAVADLRLIYADPEVRIIRELERINRRIANGDSVEIALLDFADRTNIEDIRQFAEVFAICKRTGGNLVEVMRRTSQMIGEKLEIEQEIAVQLAQKKFESRIMGVAPLAVVALLKWSSPDYMAPLYETATGRVIMTVGLILLLGCMWMIGKWMDIRV